MARTVRWVMVAGVLAAGVLGGCDSSSEDPVESPTPPPSVSSSSPSPSPSPSPTPSVSASGPDIPAAAQKQTPEGAEAYVKYFFDQFNVAWTKPQLGLIADLGTANCEFCANSEKTTEGLVAKKRRYAEDPVVLDSAKGFSGAPAGEQYVRIKFTQPGAAIVDGAGEQVQRDEKLSASANAALIWVDGRWRIQGIEEG